MDPTMVGMWETTESKETINISVLIQLVGNENMMDRMLQRQRCSDFRYHIPSAAKEMNEKIKARKKRNEKISVLEQSNNEALRVFASQLNLVKY